MHVFWEKGYEGAGLSDLTAAMGINKPSLYAKYGDKRGLFLAAMDHYSTTVAGPHVIPLIESTTVRDAVDGHLKSINAAISDSGSPPGCLISSVATDLAGRDEELRQRISGLTTQAEKFFAERFRQIGGSPMDETVLAELVMSIGQSLAARARTGATADDLNALVDRFITSIFGPKSL